MQFDPTRTRSAYGRVAVATANPLASWAAVAILRQGGAAIDAAVAAQAMLNVVEPSASGIGGGAMILLAQKGRVRVFDGISAAPSRVTDRLTRDFDGSEIPPDRATFGGRTVGVPGVLRAMELAHRAAGKLPWGHLFVPAIEAAEQGAPLAPYLIRALNENPLIRSERMAAQLWCSGGLPMHANTVFRHPELAATLQAIAEQGADAFYCGPIATDIVASVASDSFSGTLSLTDLASYRTVERRPVTFPLGSWTVATAPPPAMGGTSVGQILGIAERLGIGPLTGDASIDTLHLLAECGRLANADRGVFGDPEEMSVAPEMLLDPAYLDSRAALVDPDRRANRFRQGIGTVAPDSTLGTSMTSHIAIADEHGQMVSMTTTINKSFGSNICTSGFYLNDVVSNFATEPRAKGQPSPNALRPGRRPRTTIAPCIVLDAVGRPVAAVGAGGGYRIIGFVTNFLLRLAGGARDPQAMLAAPHALNWSGSTEIEPEFAHHEARLAERGHWVIKRRIDGGGQAIVFHRDQVAAGGDPRRDGVGMAYGA